MPIDTKGESVTIAELNFSSVRWARRDSLTREQQENVLDICLVR